MLLKIHPQNPGGQKLKIAVECVENGGVVIYPTDTVYGMGCGINQHKAVERICRIKGIRPKESRFSLIFHSLSQLSEYTRDVSTSTFKMMKRSLPGSYTFILKANNRVPKIFQSNRKTVGIRIPDNEIALEIVRRLGRPLLSTSVYDDDEITEYMTSPQMIFERYGKQVDVVIDGGYGSNRPSTVIDCTGDEPIVIREGKGEQK